MQVYVQGYCTKGDICIYMHNILSKQIGIGFYRLTVGDKHDIGSKRKGFSAVLFLVLDLDPKVYMSIRASSFTPEQSVIKETLQVLP